MTFIRRPAFLTAAMIMLSLCLSISITARAAEPILDIKEVKTQGGMTAWLVQDKTIPVIALQIAFTRSGAAYDPPDKQGLSMMLSNTMDEGAADLDSESFQKILRDEAITLYFSSNRDTISVTLKTLSERKEVAFDLLKKALTAPRFDPDPVARMIAANQARIRRSLSDPDWIAARLLNDITFGDHPYALNSGGTLSTLSAITPDDLRGKHQKTIGRNNAVIAAAGDIDADTIATLLDEMFSALPELDLPPPLPAATMKHDSPRIHIFEKNIPQTIITGIQPWIDDTDPDYHAAQILNFTLGSSGFGSRLTREIREKRGLTYGIYSSSLDLDAFHGLTVATSTAAANTLEMIALIESEWEKIKASPISPQELSDAQTYLTGSLPLSLTSSQSIAGVLLSMQLDGKPIDYLDKRNAALLSVTAKDVHTVAQRFLKPDSLVYVVVGRPPPLENAVKVQDLPNVE